jgi:hypothetical protein
VRSAFYRRAEKLLVLRELGQIGAHDVITRVRTRLVISPPGTAKIEKRFILAVVPDYNVGKISWTPAIALTDRHGHSQELRVQPALIGFFNVRKPA